MNRELLEDLHQYFEQKENKTGAETDFLSRLTGELPYFQITAVSREDLERYGFDITDVDDETMRQLSGKLCDDYCEQLFWSSMDILAQQGLDIPKHICPFCGETADSYDASDNTLYCHSCSNSWIREKPTGKFVKVEYPEDGKFYAICDMGYDCYGSQDNGAMYVPEHFYKAHEGKDPDPSRMFIPVLWPESQQYFELQHESESIFALCEPIESGNAFQEFGSLAIWVPLSLIKNK